MTDRVSAFRLVTGGLGVVLLALGGVLLVSEAVNGDVALGQPRDWVLMLTMAIGALAAWSAFRPSPATIVAMVVVALAAGVLRVVPEPNVLGPYPHLSTGVLYAGVLLLLPLLAWLDLRGAHRGE